MVVREEVWVFTWMHVLYYLHVAHLHIERKSERREMHVYTLKVRSVELLCWSKQQEGCWRVLLAPATLVRDWLILRPVGLVQTQTWVVSSVCQKGEPTSPFWVSEMEANSSIVFHKHWCRFGTSKQIDKAIGSQQNRIEKANLENRLCNTFKRVRSKSLRLVLVLGTLLHHW